MNARGHCPRTKRTDRVALGRENRAVCSKLFNLSIAKAHTPQYAQRVCAWISWSFGFWSFRRRVTRRRCWVGDPLNVQKCLPFDIVFVKWRFGHRQNRCNACIRSLEQPAPFIARAALDDRSHFTFQTDPAPVVMLRAKIGI